jgi:D-beta-D-heptose 7-phosphate kinase / D-beta-D-heptose 1-phosphate adenosyltransferase
MAHDSVEGADALITAIDAFNGQSVLIVGDLMLDEYLQGNAERISPEAPVPVVRVRHTEQRLGGAANVAQQVAVLGGKVTLAGLIGEDAQGRQIVESARSLGIDTRAILCRKDRCTTRKLRILSQSQQLLRADWEDTAPSHDAATEMLGAIAGMPSPEVIVLSDYAKGVVTPDLVVRLVEFARPSGCRILVDPKSPDFGLYRGASILTPNLRELETALGVRVPIDGDGIARATRPLVQSLGLDAIIVTLGGSGMIVVPAQDDYTFIHATRRAVFDVTGAGDTAVAVLALGIAAGMQIGDAARIANVAAGLAVSEVGTVAVNAASIQSALLHLPANKIIFPIELAGRAARWRASGKSIVFTNGCFDLLHTGHLTLLRKAAALGDILVLAINSDDSIRRIKGSGRPVIAQADRAALLAALDCVDAVTIFDDDTPLETIRQIRPHVLVKGADYRAEDVVGRDLVEAAGGRIALIPLIAEKSSSSIIEKIHRIQTHN